jgi:hypothetical protein
MPLAKRKIKDEIQFCIPGEFWICPKCGVSADSPKGGFVLDEPLGDEDAQVLSAEDEAQGWTINGTLYCYDCKYTTTTSKFFTLLMKKADMVECSCCKGHGVVSSKKANETSIP